MSLSVVLRRSQCDSSGSADRLESAISRHGSAVDVGPIQAAPAALQRAARCDPDQRHGVMVGQPLQRTAGQQSAALRQGSRVSVVVYLEQDDDRQPRLLRIGGVARREPTRAITTIVAATITVRRSSMRRTTLCGQAPIDLPGRQGPEVGRRMHPAVNAILGGWGLSSIVSAHTGFPITIAGADRSLQRSPRQRPSESDWRADLQGQPRLLTSTTRSTPPVQLYRDGRVFGTGARHVR